ncbi:14686_t:CDS:2 [Cetraspora pellucida]|uniref:14686_t:CDS:1 n=1 Tax=Cetraspora pellucida TaxID=1433469 RepID=A0ACA9P5T5_9GLOM|nr:14686_t:CDS:2 [Cetraspora pellucida]
MSASNIFNIKETKRCSHCEKSKLISDFLQQHGNKMLVFSLCNQCAEKEKQKKTTDDTENTVSTDPSNEVETKENSHLHFSAIIELNSKLVEEEMLMSGVEQFDKAVNFCTIINILLVSIQKESGYYWKFQNLYINKKNNQSIGYATAYLDCTQRDDCQSKHPDDQHIK